MLRIAQREGVRKKGKKQAEVSGLLGVCVLGPVMFRGVAPQQDQN